MSLILITRLKQHPPCENKIIQAHTCFYQRSKWPEESQVVCLDALKKWREVGVREGHPELFCCSVDQKRCSQRMKHISYIINDIPTSGSEITCLSTSTMSSFLKPLPFWTSTSQHQLIFYTVLWYFCSFPSFAF